jgi:hypothetical protein
MNAPQSWLRAAALVSLIAVGVARPAAFAQPAPAPTPSQPAAAAPAAPARLVWATTPLSGLRWPGAAAVSLSAEAGARLEVVAEEGDLLRVRLGTSFGWVPKAGVQDTEPAAAAAPPMGAPTLAPPPAE